MKPIRSRAKGQFGSAACWIGAATIICLAQVAVVAPSSSQLQGFRDENQRLSTRLADLVDRQSEFSLELSEDLEWRALCAINLVERTFPLEVEKLELYGMLRFTAESNGLTLVDLSISDAEALDSATSDLPLATREISIRGEGRLDALKACLIDLRRLGAAHVVLDFDWTVFPIDREYVNYSLTLGMFERLAELPPEAASGEQP